MLEMILAIPENIGWVIVGALGAMCGFMFYQLGKTFVQMWKERRELEVEVDEA